MVDQQLISITSREPEKQLAALQKSRLSDLIQDKGLLGRVYEAAVMMLTSEDLRACDESSILGALYKAASMGFRLEPEFGECYLIPRKIKQGSDWVSVCCFQIGYKGWKSMAMQTGLISFLEAREVYQEDEFEFKYGSGAFWSHKPADANNGITTHFYASAKLIDGNTAFEVISKQAAEKSRRNSETQYEWVGSGQSKEKRFSDKPLKIWLKHYSAMALRVPVKKVCAMLPLTPAIEAATKADGSITYLQNDEQLVTISPIEVEKIAEEPAEARSGLSPEMADVYLQTKDIVDSYSDFNLLLEYWVRFSSTPLGTNALFAELFFVKICELSTTTDHLNRLWSSIGELKKDTKLTSILSKRKKEITNGSR